MIRQLDGEPSAAISASGAAEETAPPVPAKKAVKRTARKSSADKKLAALEQTVNELECLYQKIHDELQSQTSEADALRVVLVNLSKEVGLLTQAQQPKPSYLSRCWSFVSSHKKDCLWLLVVLLLLFAVQGGNPLSGLKLPFFNGSGQQTDKMTLEAVSRQFKPDVDASSVAASLLELAAEYDKLSPVKIETLTDQQVRGAIGFIIEPLGSEWDSWRRAVSDAFWQHYRADRTKLTDHIRNIAQGLKR
jgi:hypothetical protein